MELEQWEEGTQSKGEKKKDEDTKRRNTYFTEPVELVNYTDLVCCLVE